MRISDWNSDVCSSDLRELQLKRKHKGLPPCQIKVPLQWRLSLLIALIWRGSKLLQSIRSSYRTNLMIRILNDSDRKLRSIGTTLPRWQITSLKTGRASAR